MQTKEEVMPLDLNSFQKIERTKTLKGRFVPAIINNTQHFLVNLEVFEDGLVDCWELVDLELFGGKLNSGWITTSVPSGETLSIHGLGCWSIAEGKWLFNKETYFDHIASIIKNLNPELTNLHNCHGMTTKKVDNMNVSILGLAKGKPFKYENPESYFSKKHIGESFSLFVKNTENNYSLASISVFPDSTLIVSALENHETLSLHEFEKQILIGKFVTEIPKSSIVKIYGLGECTFDECHYSTDIMQKYHEVSDLIAKLNKQKTTSQICLEVYERYIATPTVKLRDDLKVAYEIMSLNIPEYIF